MMGKPFSLRARAPVYTHFLFLCDNCSDSILGFIYFRAQFEPESRILFANLFFSSDFGWVCRFGSRTRCQFFISLNLELAIWWRWIFQIIVYFFEFFLLLLWISLKLEWRVRGATKQHTQIINLISTKNL